MKSPISRKPIGGSGWEPGFLFGQAAKISDNVALCANLDQCPFAGVEEARSARPPANSYTAPAPAYSYQSKPLWMVFICTPCVSLSATYTHTHTARPAGASQFNSLYRLSWAAAADNPDQLQGRCDRWELFEVYDCRSHVGKLRVERILTPNLYTKWFRVIPQWLLMSGPLWCRDKHVAIYPQNADRDQKQFITEWWEKRQKDKQYCFQIDYQVLFELYLLVWKAHRSM